MGKSVRVAYICNGLAKCCEKPGCFRYMKPCIYICNHTWDPKYALNGRVKKPEKYPERFNLINFNDKELCYWEGDIYIP